MMPASESPTIPTWDPGPSTGADALDHLIHLSHLIGADPRLVQPGGGNTSVKLRVPDVLGVPHDALLVKGSGTDLRTIDRSGFAPLSLERLAALRSVDAMSDRDMMRFMTTCMLDPARPAPSVETPLHALLPDPVIAHTHDVPTMSLTNVPDATAARLVEDLFTGEIVYVPYARPGFPLARAVARLADAVPDTAIGLALAHHGLVVWADDARTCHARLVSAVEHIDRFLAERRGRSRVFGSGTAPVPSAATRRRAAQVILPVVRGTLSAGERVILHFDDDESILAMLADARARELTARGMATPEHILRAGRLPLWVDVDPEAPTQRLAAEIREQIARQRTEYEAYHERHADDQRPLDDWAKVVLVPGVGMITAFRDRRSARTANVCYRAVLETIANAEAIEEFRFLPEADVFAFEHWPLERRKVEEQIARDRTSLLVPRHVVLVMGGGSGIGRAAAHRFAEEGAHVVVTDLDAGAAETVATAIDRRLPGRAVGLAADVTADDSVRAAVERAVLEFGGLDCLFYSAGVPPSFAPITDLDRKDLQRQLDVHYLGAVRAIGPAAEVMQRQGVGGSIVASVSKAALVPGREAAAYGASKAALLQALRVAAVELGSAGIRVNAINADQVDTPLFRRFVEHRAAARGVSLDEQLEQYRRRNLLGVSLIPPDAVAEVAVLLASPRFSYTTGDIVTVDGGLPEAFPR